MRSFLENGPGGHNRGAWAPLPSDSKAGGALAANTHQRIAVPAGAKLAMFSFSADVWAAYGSGTVAATVPSGWAVNDGAELNPSVRRIPADASHISVIAETACKGSVSFYAWLPEDL